MRIAIFSDVHGNLPALEAFVKSTAAEVDAYLCLGDVVNYGPWNDECLELVWSLPGIIFLEGNHERLFLGLDPVSHEIDLVRQFFDASIRSFRRSDLIANLPKEHRLGDFICSHTISDRRIYVDTEILIFDNHIIGHTHHAFDIIRSGRRLINCGSVGQNRRRLNVLTYAIYDEKTADQVRLYEQDYIVDDLIDEMHRQGYPKPCIEYYKAKLA